MLNTMVYFSTQQQSNGRKTIENFNPDFLTKTVFAIQHDYCFVSSLKPLWVESNMHFSYNLFYIHQTEIFENVFAVLLVVVHELIKLIDI